MMNESSSKIKCDKCGHYIDIPKALQAELEEKILADAEKRHKEELERVTEEISKKSRAEAIEKIRKEYDAKIESTKEESLEREEQNKKLQSEMKDMLKQLREAKDTKNRLEIEYQKKLLEEEDKIKDKAKKEAQEEMNLALETERKKNSDAQKQIDNLKRKLQQGSQQTQGEILELKLEETLKGEFIYDEIKEVPKGIRGADIIQIVKTQNGGRCGTILWEFKNTKTWTDKWLSKLKNDQRELKAEVSIIVSSVLPDNIKNFGMQNGVWICDRASAIGLAHALRQQLMKVQSIKTAHQGRESKAEVVYNYLISNEFRQRIEVWVEYFSERRTEIDKEKIYYMKKWEKEEQNIMKIMQNTAGIYGDLQGLIGNALPKVNSLELMDGGKDI